MKTTTIEAIAEAVKCVLVELIGEEEKDASDSEDTGRSDQGADL